MIFKDVLHFVLNDLLCFIEMPSSLLTNLCSQNQFCVHLSSCEGSSIAQRLLLDLMINDLSQRQAQLRLNLRELLAL